MPADSRREKIFDFVREFAVKYFRIVPVRDSIQQKNKAQNIFRGSFGAFFGPFFVLKLKRFWAVSFCRQAALTSIAAIVPQNRAEWGH